MVEMARQSTTPGSAHHSDEVKQKEKRLEGISNNHRSREPTMQKTTITQMAENPVVEPIAQAFLGALAAKGGPQIYELSVEEARRVLSGEQSGKVSKLLILSLQSQTLFFECANRINSMFLVLT